MAHILLCNDDGYKAMGIQTLAKTLESKGHRVSIVAPHEERSGQSHAMSFFTPVHVKKVSDNTWFVKGTPADCAAIALRDLLLDTPPDLVISGINHGYNLGWDVHYSGTVGAATEAAFLGFPALAASMSLTHQNKALSASELEWGFTDTAILVEQIASKILVHQQKSNQQSQQAKKQSKTWWPEKSVLNINHPGIKPKGVCHAHCRGESIFEPGIQKFVLEDGPSNQSNFVYVLGGNAHKESEKHTHDDVSLVHKGMATLTLLSFRQGHNESEEILRELCHSITI